MIEITKISSKGQVVIPQEIRERLGLEEGDFILFTEQENSVSLKKIKTPKIKTWEEVTMPFKYAAKKSGFGNEELEAIIKEVRLKSKK